MSVEKTEIETYFGRCRCCLSYGYLKNMWAEHDFEGETEIYGEMLVQCFALSWDQSEDAMDQDQICEQCICRLRDASDFKKVVLDSQEELLHKFNTENEVTVKEEAFEVQYLEEDIGDTTYADTEYTADTTYADTEYTADTADTVGSTKDETEYQEIEYLEDDNLEDIKDIADTDSSQPSEAQTSGRKSKRLTNQEDDEAPKRKWPKKLPKAQRLKTYRQYSEETFRKCMEVVRNGEMTPQEAAEKYKIPKKTICAKLKMDPKDVQIDNTTKSTCGWKLAPNKTKLEKKPNILRRTSINETTKKLIEEHKLKAKLHINNKASSIKVTDAISTENNLNTTDLMSIDHEKNVIEAPVDATQVRARYKAIANEKCKNVDEEPAKSDYGEMVKHKHNLKTILENTNATIIKGFWGVGFSCNFCEEQREMPWELKQHNLETHSTLANEAIKVKYVSELVIRLDITNLKCQLCKENLDTLEDIMHHLSDVHCKLIYTDIKNHIMPFKFDTPDYLQCAICNKDFKFFKLLSEHMSEHYRNYECPSCDRVFVNKQALQQHSYRHKRGTFECAHCSKVFDSRPKRSVHERVVHTLSNKTRKCSFCDERFSTKDLVSSHEAKVHGVEPTVFFCQACNKSYNSQSSLVTHKNRYHLLRRPHQCLVCDKAFFSKVELKSHSVTHTKIKEYKCLICNKYFGTQCGLRQHMRGHSGDRRYKCDSCERAFVNRTTFKVHMRTKHGIVV